MEGIVRDISQTHQDKSDRLTPDSLQRQIPPDHYIGATIASFAYLLATVATIRT